MQKEEERISRAEFIRNRPVSAKFKNIESRIDKETTAMEQKKREKFKPGQQGKDAMTFGGQIHATAHLM